MGLLQPTDPIGISPTNIIKLKWPNDENARHTLDATLKHKDTLQFLCYPYVGRFRSYLP